MFLQVQRSFSLCPSQNKVQLKNFFSETRSKMALISLGTLFCLSDSKV